MLFGLLLSGVKSPPGAYSALSTPMPTFTLQRIDHVVFRVTDLERSAAFYVDKLGCTVARRRPDLGLVHLQAGASQIDLVACDGPLGRSGGAAPGAEGRNVDHVCLRIEPFDGPALIAQLQSAGVHIRGPVSTNFGAEGEGPSLYVDDPDGNVVELKGPATERNPGG